MCFMQISSSTALLPIIAVKVAPYKILTNPSSEPPPNNLLGQNFNLQYVTQQP